MARRTDPWFKCFPEDWLEDTRKLTPEQRGLYFDALCLIYKTDGKLQDDDVAIAHKMHVHWRKWRSTKEVLIARGFLTIQSGMVCNKKAHEVLRERAEKRQKLSTVASEREQSRRRNSKSTDKTGTSEAQTCQSAGSSEAQICTDREKDRKRDTKQASNTPDAARGLVGNEGGIASEMIAAIMAWQSMPEANAREWLSTQRDVFSERAMLEAYGQLKTKILTGGMVPHPLRLWCSIAKQLRDAAAGPKTLTPRERAIEREREARALLKTPTHAAPGSMNKDD